MKIETAKRSRLSMKICLSGPSGSGTTYSALQLARGFSDSWENICLIDTEQGSASLYSNLGPFKVINLEAPFHPKRYNEALQLAVEAGMSVVVIDSISHEWSGKGGCLEIHEQTMQRMKIPNSFAAWGSVTPLHQDFLDTITRAKVHVICTARSKTEYVLVDRNGKQTPQKVGMAPVLSLRCPYILNLTNRTRLSVLRTVRVCSWTRILSASRRTPAEGYSSGAQVPVGRT
jgi:hypothetical protein